MPDQTTPARDQLSIIALRTVSGVQIQIQQLNANGTGFGHRLAGGKHYNQSTTTLVEHTLDAEDAREIRSMLDAAFPVAPADNVVYELRTGPDGDARPEVVAQYATALGAMEHGEAQYRAKHGTSDALEWPHTGTDDAPRWRLEAVEELDGVETLTDWHIVAVTIPAAYTPAGGESR